MVIDRCFEGSGTLSIPKCPYEDLTLYLWNECLHLNTTLLFSVSELKIYLLGESKGLDLSRTCYKCYLYVGTMSIEGVSHLFSHYHDYT